MTATRGFVTIATGNELYYKIANNLLCSYRMNAGKYPFAVICDRKNEYTEAFDKVILMDHPSNSYMDKLRLYEFIPFEETIFIDADCLVYGNIDEWWELFETAGDFSVFGYAIEDMDTKHGWFHPKGMKEFADRISFVPTYNGGLYYLRNTEKCAEVFRIAQYCADHYYDYEFAGFSKPADEPVLALGMAVCGCRPLNKQELLFAPKPKDVTVDIVKGIAKRRGDPHNFSLLHWSNYCTRKSLYKFEIGRMKAFLGKSSRISRFLFKTKIAKAYLWIYDLGAISYRVLRKIKKMIPLK
ncbi:MAG: hypothetical protein J5586_03370 [Clostridia bacterium]|nr:hypothetical protein [Clostridia bacterium]